MIGHLVTTVVDLAAQHRGAAYVLAGLLAALESLPLVGAVVPGTAVVLGLSALVSSGALGLWQLIVATVAGAIIGDGFSYWLGHHYHREITGRWPFSRYPELIARGEALFAQHGGKSVFIARFTPGVRAVVPLVAGIVGMKAVRFYAMNVLSAVVWGTSHVLSGALAGAVLVLLGAVAGRLAILAVALAVAVAAIVWLTRRAVGALPTLTSHLQMRLAGWASTRSGFIPRLVLSLVDPQHAAFPALALLGVALVGSLWLFFGIVQDLVSGDPLVQADVAVANLLLTLRNDWADRIAVAVVELGDGVVTAAVALAALIWLASRRAWRAALYGLAALGAAGAFTLLLQVLLHHPRPGTGAPGFAFPSGHITESTVLYGFLALLVGREVGPRWRAIVATTAALLLAALAFSRLYLRTDWLSDLAGGLTFGAAWVALSGLAYLRHRPSRVHGAGLAAVAGAALLVAGTVHVGLQHSADIKRYAVVSPERSMTLAAWRQGGWAELPSRRVDLLGEVKAPFTVQWAGHRDALRAALQPHGWRPAPPWTVRSTLAWLLPHAALGDLPVLPHLANGRSEGLVLMNLTAQPGKRLVLRLWRSGVTLRTSDGRSVPLWIGSVTAERSASLASLITVVHTLPDRNGPRDRLAAGIPARRLVQRPGSPRAPDWDGSILLGEGAEAGIKAP